MKKLIIILIGVVVFQKSFSQEFLIYDSLFVITEDYKGFRYFQPFKEAGLDWTEPYDLYHGKFHLRYEIFEYKAQDSMVFNLCIWSDVEEVEGDWKSWKESCFPQMAIPGKGVVKHESIPAETWWNLNDVPVDFSNVKDFRFMGLVTWCDFHHIITPWVKPEESCWDERHKYLPIKLRVTIVAVAEGYKFSGWENFL